MEYSIFLTDGNLLAENYAERRVLCFVS